MKYNEKLFVDFLENLIKLNQKSSELIEKASAEIERRNIDEKNEWNDTKKISDQQAETYSIKVKTIETDFQRKMSQISLEDIKNKEESFKRLQKCNEILSIIRSAESGITDQNIYKLEENNSVPQLNISVDDLIDGKIDFYDRAYQLNEALRKGKKREAFNISREFYAICRSAENIVNEEIITLRSLIIQNREALQKTYTNEIDRLNQVTYKEWESEQEVLKNTVDKYVKQKEISNIKSRKLQ